jgi:hypothetical protein
MRYDVSDLEWSVIEPDGPFRERCPRHNNLSTVIGRSRTPWSIPTFPHFTAGAR